MIRELRRRRRLHHLTRAARRAQQQPVRGARVTNPGSPVAAALAGATVWQPFSVGVHADGTPAYVHPGSIAGPGRLIRQPARHRSRG